MTEHWVSKSCGGEKCGMCYRATGKLVQATHKVGEELFDDDPGPPRHNLTQYVCCKHFSETFGIYAAKMCGVKLIYPIPGK